MNTIHQFYDYFDADGGRTNLIDDWLSNEGSPARARFINRIELLSGSPPGGMEDTVWKPQYVKPLSNGKWKQFKDFIEIRVKENRKQYRLIGKKIDREIFLVTWGFHDGKGWHMDITPATANERANQMIGNLSKYRREHEL
jgi:hypothetical protein